MTPFPFTILIISSYISMYNAQYFDCTGDYIYETINESPCYNQIMNCSNDCTIQCGDFACSGATINGGNGSVYVNCNGRSACLRMDINGRNGNVYVNCNGKYACGALFINAKTANLLRVNITGHFPISNGYIECPQHKDCNITGNGKRALNFAEINGTIGTKLFITANGASGMRYASIYCPPDYLSGTKYTNNAVCDISANGSDSLSFTKIYANEGFNNVRIKCESSNCYREDYEPYLICGE
eukprot:298401_1